MNKTKPILQYLFLCIFIFLGMAACKQKNRGQEQKQQQDNVAAAVQPKTDSVYIINYIQGVPEYKKHEDLIRLFYRERDYRLAWFKNNEIVPQAHKFIEVINKADKEGLNPDNYKIRDFDKMFKRYESVQKKGDDSARVALQKEIDINLSGAFFHYASDFYRGTVNPHDLKNIDWSVKRNKIKLHKVLQTILQERESSYPYYQFEAIHEGYTRLRNALEVYRQVQKKGGWPKVDDIKKLAPGDTADAVVSLRKRLQPNKKVNEQDVQAKVYDASLVNEVMGFQARHGLKPDGIIGPGTLKELNVSIDDRIDQIIINMERWRWIPKRMVPKKLPDKYLFVNIPEYKLHVFEDGKEVMDMKVIVGKVLNNTRIFSDKLEYIVFSPYWNITTNILFDEVIPAQLRNPNFMASQDMEVVRHVGKNKVEVVPISSIDWGSVTRENFKYRVRQRPGQKNPLGHVKFIFPNEYDIYLHDTPSDHLFNQVERGFSHGCIRIERPKDLAKFLLKDQPKWTESEIDKAMDAGQEKYVNLKAKVPVYIVYFTAWVDEHGAVHFRDDVYGHDAELEKAYF